MIQQHVVKDISILWCDKTKYLRRFESKNVTYNMIKINHFLYFKYHFSSKSLILTIFYLTFLFPILPKYFSFLHQTFEISLTRYPWIISSSGKKFGVLTIPGYSVKTIKPKVGTYYGSPCTYGVIKS